MNRKEKSELKKISIITTSLSSGGAQVIAVNLANYFSAKGYQVNLVSLFARNELRSRIENNVKLSELSVKSIRYTFGLYPIFPLRRHLVKTSPDIILSVFRPANITTGLASLFLNNAGVIVYREANTMHGTRLLSWYKYFFNLFIQKLTYRFATIVIANSQDTKTDLIKHRIVRGSKVKIIPNPVLDMDYQAISSKLIKDDFLTNKETKTIISVGRLEEQKNYQQLIKAFYIVHKSIPYARLIILGEGSEKTALNNLIKQLKLEDIVKIEGYKENVFPYLKNASVFALASKWEGFGNVIVEALSVGTPVVCTDCPGGPKEILDNGKYGILVPVGDVELLAKGIIETLNGQIDKSTLIARAQEYTVYSIGEKYLEAILSA